MGALITIGLVFLSSFLYGRINKRPHRKSEERLNDKRNRQNKKKTKSKMALGCF